MKNIYFTILFLACFFLQGMAQTVTIVTNSSLVCPNEPVEFTTTYTGLTEPVSCIWDFGDGITSTQCSPTNIYYTGIYNVCVTVTDADNASIQDCTNITAANEITYTSSVTNVSCSGGNDGSIICTPQGGSTNYTFLWSNGMETGQINNLAAGIYEVTISDIVGCQEIGQFIVSEPSQMGININTVEPTDCSTFDGEISASSIGGGTPPYTYLWSNGQNTAVITGLAGGMSYTVTVTDDNGCILEESTYLGGTIPGSPFGITITDYNGNIDDDGIICAYPQATLDATVSGGSAYAWSTGETTASITITTSGTYYVNVTDDNGCYSTEQVDIVFGDPSYEIVITDAPDPLICQGETITLDAGAGNLSYEWSNGATTQTITVPAGFYTVVTEDAGGCYNTDYINVGNSSPIIIQSVTATDATCGQSNGEATVITSGGMGTSYFNWSNGLAGASLYTITGLDAGTYQVTISDNNGCSIETEVIVNGTNAIDPFDIIITDGNGDIDDDGIICSYPNITLDASVTTPGVSYLWSNGNTNSSIIIAGEGNYAVTISDANGCTSEESVDIIFGDPDYEIINLSSSNDSICEGTMVTMDAGAGYNAYMWNTGVSSQISTMPAGTYTVTVIDNIGCSHVDEIVIEEIVAPDITIIPVDPVCEGESITLICVIVNNGSPIVSSTWTGNGLNSSSGQTVVASGLTAGTYEYTLSATNANGCVTFVSTTVVVNGTPYVEITPANDICEGESFTLEALGPTGTYEWSGNGLNEYIGATVTGTSSSLGTVTYDVTLTDANGCSSLASTTMVTNELPIIEIIAPSSVCLGEDFILEAQGSPSNTYVWSGYNLTNTTSQLVYIDGLLASGTYDYMVTITDVNGCTATANASIPVSPDLEIIDITTIDATCGLANGEATITVLGDMGTFVYDWSNGLSGTSFSTMTGLSAGTYQVTITDPDGCFTTTSITIGNTDGPIVTDITVTPATCDLANGTAFLLPTEYTYEWSDGYLGASHTTLTAGTYQVTVTDSSLPTCPSIISVTITEENPLSAFIAVNDATCGLANGEAEAVVSGGSGNYSYLWSNGAIGPAIIGLQAETDPYGVTITDNNTGCTIEEIFFISDDITTTFTIVITNSPLGVSCPGASDGLVTYEVTPSIGYTDEIVDLNGLVYTNGNLPGGEYCINVYDTGGCLSGTECFEVLQPMPTPITGTTETLFCPGESIVLGVNEFLSSYIWSTNETTQYIIVSVGGDYTCTITDDNGCTETIEFLNISEAEDCVWAGDANYDGLANNQDILFLGLSYGNTGNTRNDANINWEGQLAEFEWDSTFITGINQKHADSDGNGIVEHDDTLAVHQNYNLPAHALRETNLGGENILAVEFANATANYEEYVELAINLADIGETVPEAYGLAFSLTFNYPEVINPASIQVDISNSIFGSETETISLFKPLLAEGRMDFAITRFDHVGLENLQGEVLKVRFIIEDNIDGFAPTEDYVLEANLTNIYCVKTWGEEVILTPTSSDLTMFGTSSITDFSEINAVLDYYPNPAKDILYLNMKGNNTIQKVSIYDALGRLIDEENGNITMLKTSTWVEGMYFLEITDNNGQTYLIKIVKE